jgi:hypothetical protein
MYCDLRYKITGYSTEVPDKYTEVPYKYTKVLYKYVKVPYSPSTEVVYIHDFHEITEKFIIHNS